MTIADIPKELQDKMFTAAKLVTMLGIALKMKEMSEQGKSSDDIVKELTRIMIETADKSEAKFGRVLH